ncbi:Histone-lysine N-methyltransferase PRDM9 [Dirofilaria immitis]
MYCSFTIICTFFILPTLFLESLFLIEVLSHGHFGHNPNEATLHIEWVPVVQRNFTEMSYEHDDNEVSYESMERDTKTDAKKIRMLTQHVQDRTVEIVPKFPGPKPRRQLQDENPHLWLNMKLLIIIDQLHLLKIFSDPILKILEVQLP